MKNTFFSLLFTLALLGGNSLIAQNRAASPLCKLDQKVGLTDVSIEYSRPGMKDRTIFSADGLVPFGKVWRTGANSATKITFSDDVKIAGQELAKGSYAILTVPDKESWKVQFHTYVESGWTSYRDKEPALTAEAKVLETGMNIESFMIYIGNLRDNSATIGFAWENTLATLELSVK